MAAPMHPDVLLKALLDEGLTVHEYTGWKGRCRCCPDDVAHRPDGPYIRGWGDVNGTVVHITAGNLGGRSVTTYIRDIINGDDAVPVKAQFVVDPDGGVWLNSAGRANHAGKVGSRVQDHLRAADFALDDPYDDRFRGDGADGNSFTYGIENIAATKMTDAQRAASVKICAAIARHYGWTGQESVGHGEISSARYPADPNLDMGQFRRDVMAQVKGGSEPAPEPTPTPQPKTVDVKVLFQPLAGYNKSTAPGVTKWEANTDVSAKIVAMVNPDIVGTTELSNHKINPMLPRYTTALGKVGKGIVRLAGGTDGRYAFRNRASMNAIASGHFGVPASMRLNADTKQAAWFVGDHVSGLRVCFVTGHTENQDGTDKTTSKDANELRVEQALYFGEQGEKVGKEHGADVLLYVLDSNSVSWVRDGLERAGFLIGGPGYFVGWKRDQRKPFDLACAKRLKSGVSVTVATKHDINAGSDHTYLVANYSITLPA